MIRLLLVLSALATLCAACGPRHPPALVDLDARIDAAGRDRPRQFLSEGLRYLADGQLEDAGRAFALGLDADPRHPHLNFLAGFVYDLRAADGETEAAELAEVGYRLALRFDPDHWLAAYHLGRLHARRGQPEGARDAFADAVRARPDHAPSAYGLATASYLLGDPLTAAAALDRVPAEASSPPMERARAVVYAALGRADDAEAALRRYRAVAPDWAGRQAARRVGAWNAVHRRVAQAEPPRADARDAAAPPDADDRADDAATPKAAVLDAVVIEQSHSAGTSRGINLLSALQLQFGGTLIDATRTRSVDDRTGAVTAAGDERQTSLNIGVPAVTYALEIANAQDNRSELVARPSVMVFDGKEAEVFLGAEITYVTGGLDGGDSFSKEVGMGLKATPRFLPRGKVELTVTVEMSSVADTATTGSLDQALATRKSRTQVTAVVGLGQTLAIAAGSTRLESQANSGVPVLRDIPIVQYLFSRSETTRLQASTLILLTPRAPAAVDAHGRPHGLARHDAGDSAALAALRDRHRQWFRPTSNMLAVMHQLDDVGVADEFRRGDLQFAGLDALEAPPNAAVPRHRRVFDDLLDFLYF